MCDYSLTNVKSRAAVQDDKLTVHQFHTGSKGFVAVDDGEVAVCVLPGTELAFEGNIETVIGKKEHNVARFRQVDLDSPYVHHDALELPGGEIVKLQVLSSGQSITVLQLPAAPRNEAEAKEQQRLEVVG